MRVPDFFIIGAPKCGTTALHRYLRAHPKIFMPEKKEPHYFSRDLNFSAHTAIRSRDDYLGLFATAPEGALTGEASASYLYSEVAIPEILCANPAAKLIAILRNPADMAYAFHSQLLGNLNEDVSDFETAWQLQASREAGRNLPRFCSEPKFLQYRAVCCFPEQISRLQREVRAEQLLICIFEEFVHDPKPTYERILRFLGLPSDGRTAFPKTNSNRVYRNARLNRMARRAPQLLGACYLPLKRWVNTLGLRPREFLERVNSRHQPRPALDGQFRARLEADFAPDIERLEKLLRRSLEVWKNQAHEPQPAIAEMAKSNL
jgi:hypothetical protein